MQLKTKLKCLFGGMAAAVLFLSGYDVHKMLANNEPDKSLVPIYMEAPPAQSTIVEKTNIREAFVEEIKTKQELITLEVELSEEIVLDDTWINWEIFKKNQQIRYKGTGLFTVDLGAIEEESILIDSERKIVQVKLSTPTIKSIQIDENKTEYFAVDNGLLRSSSEIKLTTSEQQTLMLQIKAAMLEEMNSEELTGQAKEDARTSIVRLYRKVLQKVGAGEYTVEIMF